MQSDGPKSVQVRPRLPFARLRPPMARRSLRPQLNQIRTWVRQGRTDAWIAHQLEVTVQQIEAFRRDNDLGDNGEAGTDYDDEIDLRAEDDALIAAELDAAEAAAGGVPSPLSSRERSITARRATGCGSTPRFRTIRSMPSTGRGTGSCGSSSRTTRS